MGGQRMSHHHRRAAAVSAPDPYFSSTVLLLTGNGTNGGQNNTFLDDSSNNFTITRNGNTTQGSFSPFTGAGGSGYFDGTGDYLGVASTSALGFGTGDFTIEFWLYLTATPSSGNKYTLLDFRTTNSSIPHTCYVTNSAGTLYLGFYNGTSDITSSSQPVTTNAWIHCAWTKQSGTRKIFVNGVQAYSASDSVNYQSSRKLNIGTAVGLVEYMFGYISSLRILKGTAQYTSNFTPSTTPLSSITNTSLLLNFVNGSIVDATGKNDLETVGNAQISTTVKKYGTGSMAFDGTGDWLTVRDTADLRLGTGNFTIEFWLYLAATGSARGCVGKGTATTGWLVSTDSSNKAVFTYGSSTITSTGVLSSSTWYHVAVVREGTGTNQTKIYIDGTNDGTGTVSTDFTQTNLMYIGADRTGGSAMNGNIDDLRITKTARYTANFTPPYRQLPTR